MTGPILTDTGEYRPIPDTGIGLTLSLTAFAEQCVGHFTSCLWHRFI